MPLPRPLQISFPISGMRCDGSSCNDKGRFKVVAFSALSRFDTNGNPVGTGANDYKQGKQVPAADADVPQNDIFYGERGSSDC